MTTLVENVIVAGADNRPPMLDKSMYNSWKSRMILYIKGKEHGRIILNSILNGPLIYGTIKVDGVTRTITYEELLDKEFASVKGESLHEYYMRFAQLINDMHTVGMTMQQVQVNTIEHEAHANEVRLMRERFPDPLALVANYHHTPSYQNTHQAQYNPSHYQQQMLPVA
ncbi:hypothetical protein Tco_1151859 [Tanacetum coccineum]